MDDLSQTKGNSAVQRGVIVATYGKHINIHSQGAEYEGELRGKILRADLKSSPLAVGDFVEFTLENNNRAAIMNILPRKQFLSRPDVHDKERKQIIVANLDQLVIITSVAKPHFSEGLVDRFLVGAESQNVKALVVINKIDLGEYSHAKNFAKTWEQAGYPVIFTSAISGDGVEDLAAALRNKTSALAGHSGVGKSSLINAIDKTLDLKINRISNSTGKGVHTTAAVRMFPLKIGGWVVDTPGLKVLTIAGIDKKNLHLHFPDFRDFVDNCRFADCYHINEPNCGIKEAVEKEGIAEFRYNSYRKIWLELVETGSAI